MPNSGLTAIGNSGPSGGHAPHMERYLMAPQPWMSRMLIEVNRKVVEWGGHAVQVAWPPTQGFLMAPQLWVDKNVDGDQQENGLWIPGRGCAGARIGWRSPQVGDGVGGRCRSDGTRPGDEWLLCQSIMGVMAALGGWW